MFESDRWESADWSNLVRPIESNRSDRPLDNREAVLRLAVIPVRMHKTPGQRV